MAVDETAPARVFASPLARRLAREAGLEPASLTGSGPQGRIVRRDVEAALAAVSEPDVSGPVVPASNDSASAASAPVVSAPVVSASVVSASDGSAPIVSADAEKGFRVVPHSRIRRTIAARLIESVTTIPQFCVRGTLRVDELLRLRTELNAVGSQSISVTDLLVKAMSYAYRDVDGTNVTWTDEGMRHYEQVDIGVAVAAPSRLVTPVVREVDRLPLGALAANSRMLVSSANDGTLRAEDLAGGCATLSNLGRFGVEEFSAIINPPQSSILAIGAASQQPVVAKSGELVAASVVQATLTVDHRAIDGALAGEWMARFVDLVERPLQLLL